MNFENTVLLMLGVLSICVVGIYRVLLRIEAKLAEIKEVLGGL